MSKKKNKKKSKARSYYDYAYGGSSKKEAKAAKKAAKKARANGYYEKPKMKSVKPSLDKKDIKENKKILLTPVEVPKDFIKNRMKCNHAGELISVEKFKSMTPTYAAFTPMLDTMIEVFGEANVMICKSCYDVVVNPGCVGVADAEKAIATLYAAANVVLSHIKMKDDEVKDTNKRKENLGDWNKLIDEMNKLDEAGALSANTSAPAAGLSDEDIAKLNRASTAQVF